MLMIKKEELFGTEKPWKRKKSHASPLILRTFAKNIYRLLVSRLFNLRVSQRYDSFWTN